MSNDDDNHSEPNYPDEDAIYEKYRDDASDALEADIQEVLAKHNKAKGYYHNCPEKIKQHAEHMLKNWVPK